MRPRGKVGHCKGMRWLDLINIHFPSAAFFFEPFAHTGQVGQQRACLVNCYQPSSLPQLDRWNSYWQLARLSLVKENHQTMFYIQRRRSSILSRYLIFIVLSLAPTVLPLSVRPWYFRISKYLSVSLRPHKTSRRHRVGRHGGQGGWQGGRHGGRLGGWHSHQFGYPQFGERVGHGG